jgi:hypothetical protein
MANNGAKVGQFLTDEGFRNAGWLTGWRAICRYCRMSRKSILRLEREHELPVYHLPNGVVLALPAALDRWVILIDLRMKETGGRGRRGVTVGVFQGKPNTGRESGTGKEGPPGRDQGEGKGAGTFTE